jgi:hypothetical protein
VNLIREAQYVQEGRPGAGMMGSIMLGRAIGHEEAAAGSRMSLIPDLRPVFYDMTASQLFSLAEARQEARDAR